MDKLMRITLADAEKSKIYRIKSFGAVTAADKRLVDLGFTAGTEISLIGVAPLKETFAVFARGAIMCVRKEQAGKIYLEYVK